MLPAAFTRPFLSGLLALVPWALCAQEAPPEMKSVRKLSDSELGCAQIYAETRTLEKTGEAYQAEAMQAQAAMAETQNEMMEQAGGARGGGMGAAVGSGLLGMIPGAAQIQGHAMRAAAESRRAGMQEGMQKMMQAQTRLMHAEQALEHAQARSDHLADLFLKNGCKLSQVKAATDVAP